MLAFGIGLAVTSATNSINFRLFKSVALLFRVIVYQLVK